MAQVQERVKDSRNWELSWIRRPGAGSFGGIEFGGGGEGEVADFDGWPVPGWVDWDIGVDQIGGFWDNFFDNLSSLSGERSVRVDGLRRRAVFC